MKRKTKVMMITVSSGIFSTTNEAVKEANALKIWLQRLCQKKGYSCKAVIGVSQYNPKAGTMTVLRTGKRGRPKKRFARTNYYLPNHKTAPHIHIVLYGNPADMLCSLMADRLNNKYKTKAVWYNDCREYQEEALTYVLRQSQTIRTVEIDEKGILATDKHGFYTAVSMANATIQAQGIKFTHQVTPTQPKKQGSKTHSRTQQTRQRLQCNMNYIIYTYLLSKRKNISIKNIYLLRIDKKRIYIPP